MYKYGVRSRVNTLPLLGRLSSADRCERRDVSEAAGLYCLGGELCTFTSYLRLTKASCFVSRPCDTLHNQDICGNAVGSWLLCRHRSSDVCAVTCMYVLYIRISPSGTTPSAMQPRPSAGLTDWIMYSCTLLYLRDFFHWLRPVVLAELHYLGHHTASHVRQRYFLGGAWPCQKTAQDEDHKIL